jgi:cytochrome c-type biogenesis protein CcmE
MTVDDRDDVERDDDDIRPFAEAGRAPRPGRRFQRNRLRLGIVLAVVAGAIAFLLMQGLGSATTYFRNADEAVADRDELGTRRFRLQGTVVEGSRRPVGDAVAFQVAYDCAFVAVLHRGDPPELFREGIPVVLEGAYAAGSDRYESDRILVRHTEEYKADESERLALARAEVCPGGTATEAASS